jgi:hypothetical protein
MIGCGERVRCYVHDLWYLVLVAFPGVKRCSDIRAGQESGIVTGNYTGRQPSTQSLSDLSFGTIL